jgi:hypothetical protein
MAESKKVGPDFTRIAECDIRVNPYPRAGLFPHALQSIMRNLCLGDRVTIDPDFGPRRVYRITARGIVEDRG